MTRRRSRARVAGAGAALAILVLAALPTFVDAKILTWSISADRSSVVAGVPTVVNLTVTAALVNQTKINCVAVHIPAVYAIGSLGYTDSRGGGFAWTMTESGGTVTTSDFNNNNGIGGLLNSSSLVLHITVTGLSAGTANWSATAFDRRDCVHNPSGAPPIPMKITGSSPSPTPTPTATPTPTPTPTPTAAPTPTPTPTPRPTPAPTPTDAASPSPTVAPSAATGSSPSPSESSPPSPAASSVFSGPPSGAPGSGAAGTGSGRAGSNGLSVPQAGTGSTLNLNLTGFGSGLGAFAWTVPGFLLGLPGLLVLLILVGQMAGAALFVPLTRRILGNSKRKGRGRPSSA